MNDATTSGPVDVEIKNLVQDSRAVKSGDIFFAIRGQNQDGHNYLSAVCLKNPAALVVEDKSAVPADYKGAIIVVPNSRIALDSMAASFYEFPSAKLFVVGVTGTNGKTTTSHMIEAALGTQMPTAVMGTIDYHFQNKVYPSTHTTPDALALQKYFSEWLKLGAKTVTLEVSSHSLAQNRVDSVEFDVAVFTNLTRDHLDFHKSMEDYRFAKETLFKKLLVNSKKKNKLAVINADDPQNIHFRPNGVKTWLYGFQGGDIKIQNIKLGMDQTEFTLQTPSGERKFNIPMIGSYNVYNASAAVGVALFAGLSLQEISQNMASMHHVR
ncbi:MAG: Mur ligase family protein, partial [Candidatus Paceibacterales bacterium]